MSGAALSPKVVYNVKKTCQDNENAFFYFLNVRAFIDEICVTPNHRNMTNEIVHEVRWTKILVAPTSQAPFY